jgi:hypothetical protein
MEWHCAPPAGKLLSQAAGKKHKLIMVFRHSKKNDMVFNIKGENQEINLLHPSPTIHVL